MSVPRVPRATFSITSNLPYTARILCIQIVILLSMALFLIMCTFFDQKNFNFCLTRRVAAAIESKMPPRLSPAFMICWSNLRRIALSSNPNGHLTFHGLLRVLETQSTFSGTSVVFKAAKNGRKVSLKAWRAPSCLCHFYARIPFRNGRICHQAAMPTQTITFPRQRSTIFCWNAFSLWS